MVDVSNKYKSITVAVSSKNGNTVVAASSDTSQYWANQSRTFANQSKESVQEAKEYAELANSYVDGFKDVVSIGIADIETARIDAVDNITTVKSESIASVEAKSNEVLSTVNAGIAEINSTKTTILNDIEFVADGEKKEIQDLAGEIKDNAEDIINRVGMQLFDTVLKDHILTYEESKGLALQGTYVYKNAIAGSRYGYPDFYAKCLEEFNEATFTETVNGITVKTHSNGHKFYNIADKTAIDNYFNTMGSAWFYGIDIENERIFLPRNNWFEQASTTNVGQSIEAGLPNITGKFSGQGNRTAFQYASGAFVKADEITGSGKDEKYDNSCTRSVSFDASRCSPVYGRSDTVQPNAVKKLLYICVGNTTNYEGLTDVVNQGMDILEQVAQKVNVDGTNLTAEGKSLISGYAMPSSRYIDLTLGASGTTYTAPANGWFCCGGGPSTGSQVISFETYKGLYQQIRTPGSGQYLGLIRPVLKGDKLTINYDMNGLSLRFTYAQGSESEA